MEATPGHTAFVVRRAVPDDAAALCALALDAIRRSAAEHYTPAQLDAWAGRLGVESYRRIIAETVTLIAVDGESPAGFTSLAVESVGDLVAGEVDQLHVHPDFGGRGVARMLLDAVEEVARDRGIDRLVTHASWRAVPVFERLGYVQVEMESVAIDGEVLTRSRMEKGL